MAGSKSDAFEQRLLDHIFKGGATPALTAPTNLYIALFTTASPGEAGSSGTEVTGGSYARKSTATTDWTRTGSVIVNNGTLAFPTATASWGTIVGWGLYDASTGGNLLYYGDISPSVVVNSGDTAQFNANGLQISED